MDFYRIFASSYRLTNIFSSKNIKKIILFVLIGVILFLAFSNSAFAAEPENVDFQTANLSISSTRNYFVTDSSHSIGYVQMEQGYIYTVHYAAGGPKFLALSGDEPVEYGEYNYVGLIDSNEGNDSFSFVGNGNYLYFSWYYSAGVTVTREPLTGFNNTTNALVYEFTLDNLWAQFGFAIPLIAVAVLFALGFFVVRKVTKGEGKAKVKF